MGRALGIKGIVLLLFLHPVALFAQGSWKIIREADYETSYSDVIFVDQHNGWVVGENGLIIHTNDGGKSWEYQQKGEISELYSVDFIDSLRGWATGSDFDSTTGLFLGKILRTDNGGEKWSIYETGYNVFYDICFVDSSRGWAVGLNGVIYHTTDGGVSWKQQPSGTTRTLISVVFIDSLTGWVAAGSSEILHTINGGQNWESQIIQPNKWLSEIYFIDSKIGWAVGSHGNIIQTTDGGRNWNVRHLGVEYEGDYDLSSVCFVDSLKGWIVGYGPKGEYEYGPVILHTKDGGNSWRLEETGMRRGSLSSVFFIDSSTGWAVGHGGMGGYGTVLKYVRDTTSVKYHRSNEEFYPKSFTLFQNYPNPFNLETTIEFFLPKASRVSLSIYDIRGRVVRKLLNKRSLSSGYHKVLWDGRDQQGKSISSGVYLCILESEGNYSVKKLVAIK